MTDTYPEVVSRYFSAADRLDLTALAECFTEDATVNDEGKTYTGRPEIRAWREAAGIGHEYVVEVLDWERTGDFTYVVDTNVASTTSGDPVEVVFHFTLKAQHIEQLRIVPAPV